MRFALLALLVLEVRAADRLEDIRERGAKFEAEHRWEDATDLYQGALRRSNAELTEAEALWLRMSLVEVSFNRGEYGQSRRWLREAEESLRDRPKAGEPWVQLLNARAALYLVEGKLSAAERDLARAATAADGGGSPQLAATLHNLASLETQTGKLSRAEEHQRRALSLWRQQLGEHHEYVMKAWISLSSILALGGDWHGAERSLIQALAIAETPGALSNYAVVLDQLKRGNEAKAIRKRTGTVVMPNGLIDAKGMRMEGQRDRLQVVVRWNALFSSRRCALTLRVASPALPRQG